jgi:hypothetical protein
MLQIASQEDLEIIAHLVMKVIFVRMELFILNVPMILIMMIQGRINANLVKRVKGIEVILKAEYLIAKTIA